MFRILVLLAAVATISPSLAQMMTAYKYVELQKIVHCDGVKAREINFHLEPKAEDDTIRAYGNLSSNIDIGNSTEVNILVWRWSTSNWAKFYVVTEDNVCKASDNTMPEIIEMILESSGKGGYECPLKKGLYEINGFPFRLKKFRNFEKLPNGKFRFRILLKDCGEEIGCLEVECEVVPEDKERAPIGR